MHSFTQEDLLQYLYNETSTQQTAAIKAALEEDWNLREKFELLRASQHTLETIKLSPRQQTIDNILSYAEKSIEAVSDHA